LKKSGIMALTKTERRNRIKNRVRKIVTGTSERPRLSVFRSNKQIYAQIIDDDNATTLVAASSTEKEVAAESGNKTAKAALVGKLIAGKALAAGIQNVVFDRNGYLYHGRVKQLADAARKGGLKF
jgi:large subunit ribosomal protein L18